MVAPLVNMSPNSHNSQSTIHNSRLTIHDSRLTTLRFFFGRLPCSCLFSAAPWADYGWKESYASHAAGVGHLEPATLLRVWEGSLGAGIAGRRSRSAGAAQPARFGGSLRFDHESPEHRHALLSCLRPLAGGSCGSARPDLLSLARLALCGEAIERRNWAACLSASISTILALCACSWRSLRQACGRQCHDSGGTIVNPPLNSADFFTERQAKRSRWKLRQQGLGVPAMTRLILRPGEEFAWSALPESGLATDENHTLYVKPANGFGSTGVMRIENCTQERLQSAVNETRQRHPNDAMLIQKAVTCPRLRSEDGVERWAYWRIVHCMGEQVPFWWHKAETDQGRPSYHRLSGSDIKRLKLQEVLHIAEDLADLCRLSWFSTELCASEGGESSDHHCAGTGWQTLTSRRHRQGQRPMRRRCTKPLAGRPPRRIRATRGHRFAGSSPCFCKNCLLLFLLLPATNLQAA